MRAGVVLVGALVVAGCGGDDVMSVPEPEVTKSIVVTSPAFADGRPIPREHTCQGSGRPPELAWRGVPGGATSLVLVVSDPDAPSGTFIHWVLYDLPPGDGGLAPGGSPPPGAREAENSGGKTGWYPPCPPSGTHRYVFTVYALSGPATGRSTQDILDDLGRRAVARGTLTGLVSAG